MIIPHPFLPPRYQKLSQERNMILLLDRDMTLHIRWEGSKLHEHLPLTPRAARGLIRECLGRMTKYRRDLQVFSKFIEENAEQPFDDPRALDPIRFKERELPPAQPLEEETEDTATELVAEIQLSNPEIGGESPMPMMEEFYGE